MSRFVLRCALLLCVISWPGLSAEVPQTNQFIRLPVIDGTDLRFAHISSEERPSYSRVGQIVQDDQGFIWFGTHNGVVRYDGYRFREYRHDPTNPNTLSGSYINALFKDRSGKLWVASDKNVDRYDPATEVFTQYRPGPAVFEGWVSHVSQDRQGTIWLATHHGLNKLDPVTWRSTRYQHKPGDVSSLSSDSVVSTLEGKDGSFWVSTAEAVELFDRATGKVIQHFPLPSRLAPNRTEAVLISLCEDHTGAIWVAFSFGDGLARVDRSTNKLIYYSFGDGKSGKQPLTGIRDILEDENGNLWLATANNGILKLDGDRHQCVRYRNDPADPSSLSSDQVVRLFEDRENNIWAGTTGGGVNRFPAKPLPFKTYRHVPGNRNSLPTNYTSSVFQDSRGIVWVGSTQVLTAIDPKKQQFTFYRATGGPRSPSATWAICIAEDRSHYIWFGTIDGGLNRFDFRTGRFNVYRHKQGDPNSLSSDTVRGLLVDHAGTLWAATEDGLDRFDPRTEEFRHYRGPGDNHVRYRPIVEDSKGVLWLGTLETGLRRLDPLTGRFTDYRYKPGVPGTLSSDQVNALCVDRSGVVWAGTENGLDRFDPSTGTFTAYYERDGLPSSTLSSILEAGNGELWLGTSNGLSRFDPRTKTFKNYYASDGLLGNEFYNYASAYKSRTGEMFFNSYAGVISFFPDQIIENLTPPPIVLTDLLLFGKSVPIGRNSPLKQSISDTKSLTLSHAQNILSLEFSALSYSDPARNRYRYKLEGLESEWNETDSSRRSATYTTLAAGQYTFRVQGRNNRGAWSQNGASVRIEMLPPWWSTWWFRTIYIAGILIAVWIAFYLRVRGIQHRNRELAAQVAERTAAEQEIKALSERLISAQEQERMHIAQELHDDLNQQVAAICLSVSAARARLLDRDSDSGKQLELAYQRLLQLSARVRGLSHELHPTMLEYGELSDALRTLCSEFSALSGVNVSFSAIGDFNDLSTDRALCLYRVTQEALQNVAKHSAATSASVYLKRSVDRVFLTVSDSGIGFQPQHSRASGGLGLVSIKERVRLVSGKVGLESEPNRGTTLRIEIPLGDTERAENAPSPLHSKVASFH